MAFKDELKKAVPARMQATPEFNILLGIIKKQHIPDKKALKMYLDVEIKTCRDWINKNKSQSKNGTMTRWLRSYTKKLDFFQTVEKQVLGYL